MVANSKISTRIYHIFHSFPNRKPVENGRRQRRSAVQPGTGDEGRSQRKLIIAGLPKPACTLFKFLFISISWFLYFHPDNIHRHLLSQIIQYLLIAFSGKLAWFSLFTERKVCQFAIGVLHNNFPICRFRLQHIECI